MTTASRRGAAAAAAAGSCALAGVLATAACGPAPSAARAPAPPKVAAPEAFPREEARWPKFHSARFRVSVPLPDGKLWRVDDHTQPELRAVHPATGSRLVLSAWSESELMNRERCEERARNRGLVEESLSTVEDAVTVGPDAYDTRVWVAVKPGKDTSAPVVGHVYAFGAFIRRCLFLDFATEVAAKDEEALSSRLALVKVRVVGGLTLDAPRTTADAEIPAEKPARR